MGIFFSGTIVFIRESFKKKYAIALHMLFFFLSV